MYSTVCSLYECVCESECTVCSVYECVCECECTVQYVVHMSVIVSVCALVSVCVHMCRCVYMCVCVFIFLSIVSHNISCAETREGQVLPHSFPVFTPNTKYILYIHSVSTLLGRPVHQFVNTNI